MSSARSIYRLFAAVAAALFVLSGTGCRHDVVNEQGETVSAVITPLQIGPLLWPVGEEDVTTYGISTGLATKNLDSYGIFVPIFGTVFYGMNYGIACSLVCGSNEAFNGIATGVIGGGDHNGISIFPIDFGSGTNGLSVEGITIGKGFNGIDFCLCNIYGTGWGAGLQMIGVDFSTHDDSKITGCQIGGILTSAVRGAQIGAVTYNPKVGINRGRSFGKCLNLGVMNLDLTEGFQVGVVNNTSEGNPVQVGLFNTTFEGSPFQIGLLNINPNGFLPIFPFFNYSVKKGAYERDRESAVGF